MNKNGMDYISMDVKGTCVSVPVLREHACAFEFENRRGDTVSKFYVIIRNKSSLTINKGDRIFITKAGFFTKNGTNYLAVVEGSSVEIDTNHSDMDYISIDVVGTCVSVPARNGRIYTFELENRRGEVNSKFHVIVRDESPIDVNEGDRVIIAKAGFFTRDGINNLAVVEGSGIEIIRIRCNLGEETV